MTTAFVYTLVPVAAAMLGAVAVMWRRPGPILVSAIQHFTAGVVFAAAAGEILPDVMHCASPLATLIGGALGVGAVLLVKQMETWAKGPVGLMTAVGIDVLIDGLVLGLGFAAGQKQGLLLTVALTLELLFLSLTVTAALSERFKSPVVLLAITAGLATLLPAGALFAVPAAAFPPQVLKGLFSFARRTFPVRPRQFFSDRAPNSLQRFSAALCGRRNFLDARDDELLKPPRG